MSLFSRCEPSAFVQPGLRAAPPRRARTAAETGKARRALLGFCEDIGILVRYAAGLDYYDRAALSRRPGV